MPYLSIIVPTTRVGGLDILATGLSQQSFKDFELIVVDGIYDQRHDKIISELNNLKFPVKHIAPLHNLFPLSMFCRSVNTGIVHATGKIVLFLCDYTLCPPGLLEYHVGFHQNSTKRRGLMCPHQYYSLPPVSPIFLSYSDDTRSYNVRETERYAVDVRSGKLDSLMWSLFVGNFNSHMQDLKIDPIMGGSDPKLSLSTASEAPGPFFNYYLKNESCELDALLDVNGLDEELDGTNCCQDLDLAHRLHVLAGVTWVSDPNNTSCVLNPRHIFPCPIRIRDHKINGDIWLRKRIAGYPEMTNLWSLRGMRLRFGIT